MEVHPPIFIQVSYVATKRVGLDYFDNFPGLRKSFPHTQKLAKDAICHDRRKKWKNQHANETAYSSHAQNGDARNDELY